MRGRATRLPDRQADRQPQPHPRQRGRDLAVPQERRDRDRGPPLLQPRGRRLHRHRPRAVAGHPAPQAAQGGSTITQQFVKNALSAQGDRSVFQKLRESALAYHLERKWSKEKILTQYLNTVYFGNGAYGVEAAARTYFGDGDEPEERESAERHGGRDAAAAARRRGGGSRTRAHRESRTLSPAEAALLAGMISSPSMYDPLENPTGFAPAPRPGARPHARPEHDHPPAQYDGGAAPVAARRRSRSTRPTPTPSSPTSRAG